MKEDNNEIERVLRAKPVDEEPNRSHIKWSKRKKPAKIKRKTTPSMISKHPGTQDARKVLSFHGRNLNACQNCGKRNVNIAVHHKDGNPYNNGIENLQVLCLACHGRIHRLEPGVVYEANEITDEFDTSIAKPYKSAQNSSVSVRLEELPEHIRFQLESESSEKKGVMKPPQVKKSQYYGLQCRLCSFYRSFKKRCEQKNEEVSAFQSKCEYFEF